MKVNSEELLHEMVEREAVEVGCYSAPDPRTRFQKLRDRLFPSKHCFAPEAPEEFEDCIHGKATTHLSIVDRLRVLLTGVVITQWRTVTEHKPGRTINAATCHIGTAKDLAIIFLVLLFSVPCFAQDRFQLNTPSRYERYDSNAMALWRNRYDTNPPKLYGGDGTYLGRLSVNPYVTDSIANPYNNYGSRYSPTSIQNPYSPYGGRYPSQSIYVYPRGR